jgi:protein-disulfide isomerase
VAQRQRKGAQPARQSATSLKPFYIILGVVALVGIGGILFAMRGGAGRGVATEPADLSGVTDAQELVARARGVAVGPDNAPVQVLVFSDYMCPWCAEFALGSEKQLKSEFVEPGQVQFIYYDFPLGGAHVHSFLAARAARCAEDQGRFWEFHDVLFERQRAWMGERAAPISTFNGYAQELGLDMDEFRGCLNSDRHQELVTANYVLGAQLGVSGTPTVFVNGRRVGNPTVWSNMREAVQQQIGS